jgi:hypothetical protein
MCSGLSTDRRCEILSVSPSLFWKTRKDEYELGDFVFAMDEISKQMTEELTGTYRRLTLCLIESISPRLAVQLDLIVPSR